MKPILNVVFLSDILAEPNRGIYQRLSSLSKRYDVRLFTLNEVFVDQQLANKIEIYKFPFKIGKLQKILFSFWCLLCINNNIKQNKYQIVYTINHQRYLMGYLAKMLFKTMWIIDFFHSPFYRSHIISDLKHYPLLIYDRVLVQIFRKVLPKVDLAMVMAHSDNEGFAKLLNKEFNVPRDKIVAVPDGVDIAYVEKAVAEKKKEKSTNSQIKLVHVGSMNSKKFLWGLDLLSEIKKEYPNLELVLMGNYTSDRFTRDKINSWLNNNENWVEYHGWVEHKKALKIISNCHIGLCILDCSVLDYNFCHPNKVFEYMALKKAVLAPNLEGIRGIIRNGVDGLLYNCNDDTDFVIKLKYLIDHEKQRQEMGENAGKYIKRFDWKRLNKTVMQAFERVT